MEIENVEVRPTIFCQEQADGAQTEFNGSVLDLLGLYTHLSVQFWNQLAENTSEDFAVENYKIANKLIIENSCIKKSYDEFKKANGDTVSLLKELMDALRDDKEDDDE